MTETQKIKTAGRARTALPVTAAAVIMTILFILDIGGTREAVSGSLKLSVTSVIPAVFPCAVLSGIIVRLGGAEKLGKIAERPMRALFALPGEALCALLLGFFCGFPIGAKSCAELYIRGCLSRDEAERLLAISSLPSPAFVINAVGKGMLKSRSAGIFLFLALLALSLLSGTLISIPARKKHSLSPLPATAGRLCPDFGGSLISAVNSAADAMLRLCAFSAFFAALSAALSPISVYLPDTLNALLAGSLELTGGCASAAACAMPLPTTAAILGWTGLAVHFQVLSVTKGDIPPKRYFLVSLLRSAAMFFAALFVRFPLSDI